MPQLIENDTQCDVRFAPWIIAGGVGVGILLLLVDRLKLLENGIDTWTCGVVTLVASLFAIPYHIRRLPHRCRSLITDEGVDFLPTATFGCYSFRWADVIEWEFLTEYYGDSETGCSEQFQVLELRTGEALKIPSRFHHPEITKQLNNRINPTRFRELTPD